jgi:hypothetical protein
MMDLVADTVKKIEDLTKSSGCETGGVHLEVDPDARMCEYEKGACLTATFGGMNAEFVTSDPVTALVRISFLFDAPLDTNQKRSAACAVINVVAGFFCLSRVLRSCLPSQHNSCMNLLQDELAGHTVCCVGRMPTLEARLGSYLIKDPENAEIILINGEGIIREDIGELIVRLRDKKRILCLGPSPAGVARIQKIEHWCPFGTSQ